MQEIAINTKVTTKAIKSGDMGSSLGPVGIFTKGTIREMCEVGMERCIGRMAAITRDNG